MYEEILNGTYINPDYMHTQYIVNIQFFYYIITITITQVTVTGINFILEGSDC